MQSSRFKPRSSKHLLGIVCCAVTGFAVAITANAGGNSPSATSASGPAASYNSGHPAKPDEIALKAAAALYDGIREKTLPNGLRVFLKPVPSSPVVTTMVAYRVGSADEDLDNTGLSHYLEHLMFKGTDKLMPGDIDHQTLINGGANNAYTATDFTIFHFDLAADRWEMALAVEADRMRNLKIDERHEFQQEKGAVCAELSRDEDEPWDLEQKAHRAAVVRPKESLRPSCDRSEEARRGRDGRDHQGPLRQVVSPEQRHAHRLRRHRPRSGDGPDQATLRPDPEGDAAGPQVGNAGRAS